jgi:hypothetical protein
MAAGGLAGDTAAAWRLEAAQEERNTIVQRTKRVVNRLRDIAKQFGGKEVL